MTREKLFDKILDQLAASSLFSNSTLAPSIFIVYAHDNENEGIAFDGCVRKTISWLQKIHARILSDQSPLPLLLPRIEGTDAIRNIVANQMCLLPGTAGSNETPIRTSVDKVIVCGSEVLERYCNKLSAELYIQDIVRICSDGAEQPGRALESSVLERVEEECGQSDFHHILTELAFLEVRKSAVPEAHGMVPIALNQLDANAAPMQYLPTFRSTDVKLKLKSPTTSSLHKLFFKLLIQLFPEDADFIEPFRECYASVSETLEVNKLVRQEGFEAQAMRQITEAYRKYWRLFCVVIRDGKLQAYTRTGKSYCASRIIDWVRMGLALNKNDEAFAYFYCNKQYADRSEAKAILRNIIRQLATGPWKPEGFASSTAVHKKVYEL
ncbi:hypothetical protein SLS63_006484 [Diaporthe eres]|uniref:Nephrocystin 3-like N-terminal domain-containing protein n=1 Tax=Diaporthe eres TaxID=83184 RepID=A0ABR1P8K8_DIAER